MPEPEVSGFAYVEDDAAYRIKCLSCGETAGTLGRSEDYAHGVLDAWASDHRCRRIVCSSMDHHDRQAVIEIQLSGSGQWAPYCDECADVIVNRDGLPTRALGASDE